MKNSENHLQINNTGKICWCFCTNLINIFSLSYLANINYIQVLLTSNDPGRSNIMFVHVQDNIQNKTHYFRLTRQQYYNNGKINSSQKKTNTWINNSSELFDDKSMYHFKSSNVDSILESIQFYGENFENLWNTLALTRKWSKNNFRIYNCKRSCISKFLNGLKPRNTITNELLHTGHIMFYGNGSFPCGGKGEQNVPLKYIKKP